MIYSLVAIYLFVVFRGCLEFRCLAYFAELVMKIGRLLAYKNCLIGNELYLNY